MLAIPEKLYKQASALGFICSSTEQHHSIQPGQEAEWQLVYQRGYWVLVVHDIPQMRFRYEEVLTFLDRFSGRRLTLAPEAEVV